MNKYILKAKYPNSELFNIFTGRIESIYSQLIQYAGHENMILLIKKYSDNESEYKNCSLSFLIEQSETFSEIKVENLKDISFDDFIPFDFDDFEYYIQDKYEEYIGEFLRINPNVKSFNKDNVLSVLFESKIKNILSLLKSIGNEPSDEAIEYCLDKLNDYELSMKGNLNKFLTECNKYNYKPLNCYWKNFDISYGWVEEYFDHEYIMRECVNNGT